MCGTGRLRIVRDAKLEVHRVGNERTNTEQALCSFVWLLKQVLFICSGSTRVFIVRSVHDPQECSEFSEG
jgi:hypothetical protein